MAIHITSPATATDQMLKMHELIAGKGKNFLKKYAEIVERLAINWSGSDALANQKDLANVYAEVTKLLKKLDQLIVIVNNGEVYPLLNHIQLSGGDSYKKEQIAESLQDLQDTVSITTEAVVSKTEMGIIQDAEDFKTLPETFVGFKDAILAAKEELFRNWLDGANIADAKTAFRSFENNVDGYITQVKKVRDNLNIVAENKRKLL